MPLPQSQLHTQSAGLPPPPAPARVPQFPDLGANRQTPIANELSGHDNHHPNQQHPPYAQSLMHSIQRLHHLRQEGDRIHQEFLTHRNPGLFSLKLGNG
jgi:hypothetical protein